MSNTPSGQVPKPENQIPDARRPFTLPGLLLTVCAIIPIAPTDMIGKGRSKQEKAARMAYIVLAKAWGWSFMEASEAMGRKRHSTLITAYWRFHDDLGDSETLNLARSIVTALPSPPEPEAKRIHSQLDGDPALQRKLLDEVRQATDIRSEPVRPETETLHGLIASVPLPRIPKPNGEFFKHATVRSTLHGVAQSDWQWVSLSKLGPCCGTTPSTLIPLLAGLCAAGLVERQSRPRLGLGRGLAVDRYRVCEHKLRALLERTSAA